MKNIFVTMAVVVVIVVLWIVSMSALGAPRLLVLVVPIVGFGLFASGAFHRSSTRQLEALPVPAEGEAPSVDLAQSSFTNMAFSDKPPTWKGWSKEIGVLSISPERVAIVGRKKQLAIDAPFTAELLDHKFLTWTMVKVKGSVSANQSKTMYLVVHGAPLTIGGADPEEVTRSSQHLVSEINSVRPT